MRDAAPVWLLLLLAAIAWTIYAVEVAREQRAMLRSIRARDTLDEDDTLPTMPPGIPSIIERLDRWQ